MVRVGTGLRRRRKRKRYAKGWTDWICGFWGKAEKEKGGEESVHESCIVEKEEG